MSTSNARRDFLRQCCVLGAAGVTSQLTRLGLVTAHAQAMADYKALVCVFLFGGNDANNTIVPIDSRYNRYQAMRPTLALPQANLRPAGASGYGLHPALVNVQRLYDQSRVATVFNVGTLVEPTTRDALAATALPRNLYSHSDQTQQWQSSDPAGGATGWGGRINDAMAQVNTGRIPAGITVNGTNALFLSGLATTGLSLTNTQSSGLQTFGSGGAVNARLSSLQRLLTFDSGLKLVSAANGVLADGMRSAQDINGALAGAPALPVAFPNTTLGRQLAQVAQVIAVHGTLGMNRQIFFAGLGGFDHHEDLVKKQQALMAELDACVGAFMADARRARRVERGDALHRERVQPDRQRQCEHRRRSRVGQPPLRDRWRRARRRLRHVSHPPTGRTRRRRRSRHLDSHHVARPVRGNVGRLVRRAGSGARGHLPETGELRAAAPGLYLANPTSPACWDRRQGSRSSRRTAPCRAPETSRPFSP